MRSLLPLLVGLSAPAAAAEPDDFPVPGAIGIREVPVPSRAAPPAPPVDDAPPVRAAEDAAAPPEVPTPSAPDPLEAASAPAEVEPAAPVTSSPASIAEDAPLALPVEPAAPRAEARAEAPEPARTGARDAAPPAAREPSRTGDAAAPDVRTPPPSRPPATAARAGTAPAPAARTAPAARAPSHAERPLAIAAPDLPPPRPPRAAPPRADDRPAARPAPDLPPPRTAPEPRRDEVERRSSGWFAGVWADASAPRGAPLVVGGLEVGGHLGRALTVAGTAAWGASPDAASQLGFLGIRPGLAFTPDRPATLHADVLLGVGAHQPYPGRDVVPFNVVEPRLGAGLRLGRWGRLSGHVGYRAVPAVTPGANLLSGPTVGVGVRIGAF
jgi:hypothetical protein